jgi:aspartate beta-hydroxylase
MSAAENRLLATVVQSALFRTRGLSRTRPFPSKLVYPGLSGGQPLWNTYMEKYHSHIGATLRENYDAIREDYENLRTESEASNAIAGNKSDYVDDEHRLHTGDWDWQSYMQKGEVSGDFASKFPNTVTVLESLSHSPVLDQVDDKRRGEKCQSLFKGIPFGYAFFSNMGPKSAIEPHYGPCNFRVRCHFPLIVPSGDECGMEIGGQQIKWEQGKPLFFDDSYSHHVWNRSSESRVVLLFDIWHPELERDEVDAIKDMFAFLKKENGDRRQVE